MATESTAPSSGSVPLPSSSRRTRLREVLFLVMEEILVIWEEKVEKDSSMLCPSPISVQTESKMGRIDSSSAGMKDEIWLRRTHRARVFMVTVFPPALAPLRTSTLVPSSRSTVTGTQFFPRSG